MWNIAFNIFVVFAYLSIGYYIAKKETSKALAVRSFSAMSAYMIFGPFVVVVYTFDQIIQFGFRIPAKAVRFLAKYLPKNKTIKLKPKKKVSSDSSQADFKAFGEQLLGQQNSENNVRRKELDSKPDVNNVIHVQFPRKEKE